LGLTGKVRLPAGSNANAKPPCATDGRSRYNHDRRFSLRGMVNAVPESCSAKSPHRSPDRRTTRAGILPAVYESRP
jgi:hypothetical protein